MHNGYYYMWGDEGDYFITFTHYNVKTSYKRPYNDRLEFSP